jgi:hypothetical protein
MDTKMHDLFWQHAFAKQFSKEQNIIHKTLALILLGDLVNQRIGMVRSLHKVVLMKKNSTLINSSNCSDEEATKLIFLLG